MKALFKKDLRENLAVGLVGMGIFGLFILIYGRSVGDGATGEHPLLSSGLISPIIFLCGLYGAILGWVQSRNEANPDLWAFLIHRPITRTQIFWSKTAAGLCLYFVASGLPLVALICYCAVPGTIAAPFEPAMALPGLLSLLLSVPYYFAGLLTGLRRARWYGSRTFGFGAALLSSLAITSNTNFWWYFLYMGFWTLVLAVAVWGAYQTGGFYRGQPRASKSALTFSITGGAFIVSFVFLGLLEILARQSRDIHSQDYVMTVDGQLCIHTTDNNTQSYTDLAGKPVYKLANGKRVDADTFVYAPGLMMGTNSSNAGWWNSFSSSSRFYNFWDSSGETVWYLDHYGKLTGFDKVTRRHIGDISAPGGRFIQSLALQQNFNPEGQIVSRRTLAAGSIVYRVNLETQTIAPLFTVPDAPITDFAESHFWSINTNVIVVTRKNIGIFELTGKPVMSVPYQPGISDYPQIQILALNNPDRYAVWFYPDFVRNEKANHSMRERVIWIADAGQIAQTVDLPDLPPQNAQPQTHAANAMERFITSLTPPLIQFRFIHGWVKLADWDSLWPAGLCVLLAGSFARRYRFSAIATAAWLFFILICGIPALLAFFAVQEWPKRETCPNCRKLRVVDREHCEHCGALFPPPEKIGIEIFEPIASP